MKKIKKKKAEEEKQKKNGRKKTKKKITKARNFSKIYRTYMNKNSSKRKGRPKRILVQLKKLNSDFAEMKEQKKLNTKKKKIYIYI